MKSHRSDFHDVLRKSLDINDEILKQIGVIKDYLPEFLLNHHLGGVFYILDYRQQKYLYLSRAAEALSGYSVNEILEGGIVFVHHLIHPEDRQYFTKDFAKLVSNRIASIPEKELSQYRFSLNYRLKRKDGVYIKTLSQYSILSRDEQKRPLIAAGVFSDITAFKKDDTIRMQVTKYKSSDWSIQNTELFFESHNDHPLTMREIDVVRCVSKGMNNEAIAADLSVSVYTIRAHRRNILRKMKTSSFAKVLTLASEQKWI